MPKPAAPKITDFETTFDAVPVAVVGGEVIWADVRIDYLLSGLAPSVVIRVPVPWNESETVEERKGRALRCARELIDHACRAAGVPSEEDSVSPSPAERLDAATPAVLEGIARELGPCEAYAAAPTFQAYGPGYLGLAVNVSLQQADCLRTKHSRLPSPLPLPRFRKATSTV